MHAISLLSPEEHKEYVRDLITCINHRMSRSAVMEFWNKWGEKMGFPHPDASRWGQEQRLHLAEFRRRSWLHFQGAS